MPYRKGVHFSLSLSLPFPVLRRFLLLFGHPASTLLFTYEHTHTYTQKREKRQLCHTDPALLLMATSKKRSFKDRSSADDSSVIGSVGPAALLATAADTVQAAYAARFAHGAPANCCPCFSDSANADRGWWGGIVTDRKEKEEARRTSIGAHNDDAAALQSLSRAVVDWAEQWQCLSADTFPPTLLSTSQVQSQLLARWPQWSSWQNGVPSQPLQLWWRQSIAQRVPSPLGYPYHAVCFSVPAAVVVAVTTGSIVVPPAETVQVSQTASPVEESPLDPGPLLQPYSSESAPPPSDTALRVAEVLRRILLAHTELCNEAVAGRQLHAFAPLLGQSIYTTGYPQPEDERPDTTFKTSCEAPGAATDGACATDGADGCADHGERAPGGQVHLQLCRHFDATHINVCCGVYYYQLEVIDVLRRRLCDVARIARGLDVIVADAAAREQRCEAEPVSDEVKDDLRGMRQLLSRLSAVDGAVAADVHRRLRAVSDVNAYTLDQLEAGLLTVVLGQSTSRAGGRPTQTQWLHSVLSLYAGWGDTDGDVFVLRAHAMVTSLHALKTLLARALTLAPPAGSGGRGRDAASTTDPRPSVGGALGSPGGGPPLPLLDGEGPSAAERCTVLGRGTGVSLLELWLPLKHRIPLRPYAPLAAPRHYRPMLPLSSSQSSSEAALDASSTRCHMAALCLAVIIAVRRMRRMEVDTAEDSAGGGGEDDQPSVLVAWHAPHTSAPSAALLSSAEVEAFLQVLHSRSVLLTPAVRHAARAAAVASLHRQLQSSLSRSQPPVYSVACMLSEAPALVKPVDMCITVDLLLRPPTSHPCPPPTAVPGTASPARDPLRTLQSCHSDLGVPARLLLQCTAEQVAVQKTPQLGDATVRIAEVGATDGDVAARDTFVQLFTEALASAV